MERLSIQRATCRLPKMKRQVQLSTMEAPNIKVALPPTIDP
jgi:hypothetical protein